ncbi:BadF-type ATPase [Sinosporangium album]|uniref:BadF-type ATPase n=1 Tax=Sinosporangium album TaxID=504805 RepID=A0A1G7SXQ0_9ACTN|nr:BadF/BadG/BcrA/BcrD ATPase family protein [Sinosporangium album]SDG27845.1 BadF-type ATPase [Sinosporangium album]
MSTGRAAAAERHLVVGVDGGGTSTRCVVATVSGEVVGRGHAGGANILSAVDPVGSLRAALAEALHDHDATRVAGGVFALAGAEAAGERAPAAAGEVWRRLRLSGAPEVVSDLAAAFSGATEEPSGTVLIAGTGAVAARIADRRVTRRADGHGYLLGDEGSGVWIGRRAVQAVLAALEGRAVPTALLAAVTALPGAPENPTPGEIVRLVHAGLADAGPAWLGRLAPAVEAAARAGDNTALAIVEDAAERLTATLRSLGPADGPTVLAGSLLTEPTLLADEVRARLAGAALVPARDSAAGAAALALHALALHALDLPDAPAAHRRLIG